MQRSEDVDSAPELGRRIRGGLALLAALAQLGVVATAFADLLFGNPEFYAGSSPWGIAAADLDGDGDRDLVVGNDYGDQIAVLLNRGDGLFGTASLLRAHDRPRSVAIGDVDGDLIPDIVAGNYAGPSGVTVMLGSGGGSFVDVDGGAVSYSVASTPLQVTLHDLDGDADLDLLATGSTAGRLSVRLNDGSGGFGPDVQYGSTAAGLAVDDVSGDGNPDVVVAGFTSTYVLIGDGAGGFAAPVHYDSGRGGFSDLDVALGDVDGDGDRDMVVAHNGNHVGLLRNLGGGAFGPATLYTVGYEPSAVALADLDGDGAAEIVVAHRNSADDQVSVLRNDGGGSFAAAEEYRVEPGANSVAVADFDGDGRPDVVTASNGCSAGCLGLSGVSLLLADASLDLGGERRNESGGSAEAEPHGMAVADVDGDGAPDLFVGNTGAGNVTSLRNLGGGHFTPHDATGSFYGRAAWLAPLAVRDLDGDGDPDLAAASVRLGIFTLLETQAGLFAPPRDSDRPPGGRMDDVALEDIDADGDFDLLGLPNGPFDENATLVVSRSSGGFDYVGFPPAFAPFESYPIADDPRAMAVGDVDGDGDADVLVAHGGGSVSTLRYEPGSGGFLAASALAVGGEPATVWLGDLDGDTDRDLAVADHAGAVVRLFRNPGNGAFAPAGTVAVGAEPHSIVSSDFDADGDTDLAVLDVGFASGHVALLLNDGSGGMQEAGRFRVGHQVPGLGGGTEFWGGDRLVAADLDRDGDVDLAVVNPGDDDVSVLLNRLVGPEFAGATLGAGGSVGTDDGEGDGAGATDPVETTVTTPTAGHVSIAEGPITVPAPPGWLFIGQQVEIEAPAATPADPLLLLLRLDASRVPEGSTAGRVRMFKSGLLVGGCGGSADPDPCVVSRSVLPDGDVEIAVRTSTASPWNFGLMLPGSFHLDLDLLGPGGLERIRFGIPEWLFELLFEFAFDEDEDGRDEMDAAVGAFEASASSSLYGELKLRLRDPQQSPYQVSVARIEEDTGQIPGLLELPPFTLLGSASVVLTAYLELDVGQLRLHNEAAIAFSGGVTRWPPAPDESLKGLQVVDLVDEQGQTQGFELQSVTWSVPPPEPPPPPFVPLPLLSPAALAGVASLLLASGVARGARRRRV